jgi:hypothetical protein
VIAKNDMPEKPEGYYFYCDDDSWPMLIHICDGVVSADWFAPDYSPTWEDFRKPAYREGFYHGPHSRDSIEVTEALASGSGILRRKLASAPMAESKGDK